LESQRRPSSGIGGQVEDHAQMKKEMREAKEEEHQLYLLMPLLL